MQRLQTLSADRQPAPVAVLVYDRSLQVGLESPLRRHLAVTYVVAERGAFATYLTLGQRHPPMFEHHSFGGHQAATPEHSIAEAMGAIGAIAADIHHWRKTTAPC